MDADDGCSGEDGGGGGGEGGVAASLGRDVGRVDCRGCIERETSRESPAEERFARDAGEQGCPKFEQLVLVGEERVVVVEGFAEAVAGIENDAAAIDAGGEGAFQRLGEAGFHKRDNFILGEGRLGAPFVGAAAGVHEDDAALQIGAGLGHGEIPFEAGDVVDDFGAGGDGGASGFGFICINREHRFGTVAENGFDDGEDAVLLLLGADGIVGAEFLGAGAGGFAADVDEVGALIEHGEGVLDGGVRVEKRAAIGERVGGDVEDAHDEGALAEWQGAGA